MTAKSPEDRALIARIAAATRWAGEPDRVAATERARSARREQFERQAREACPGLTDVEYARRAGDLMRAHMLRMTLRAQQARRKAREMTSLAEAAEQELREVGGAA